MKKIIIISVMISLLILGCAREKKVEFGIVTLFYGDIKIEKQGKIVNPEIKMVLRSGDKINVGSKSRIDMQLGNFGIIRINQNSEVEMERLLKETTDDLKLLLRTGQVLCKLEKLKKAQSFSVETPTAVVGVRGTIFIVDTSEKKKETSVAVTEGKVEMASKKEPEKKVIVKENQSAEVSSGIKIPKIINKINIKKLKQLKEFKKLKILKNIKKMNPDQIKKYLPKQIRGIDTKKIKGLIKNKNIEKVKQKVAGIEKKIKETKIKEKIEKSVKQEEEVLKKAEEAKKQAEKAKEKLKKFFK